MDTLENLEQALITLAEAQIKRNQARTDLEHARATEIVEGVPGKNAEEREANLRLKLVRYYNAVEEAETALIWAKTNAEIARLRHEAAGQIDGLTS